MNDQQLKNEILSKLAELERTIDRWSDTPKRHKASELIVEFRKLAKAPVTRGYER